MVDLVQNDGGWGGGGLGQHVRKDVEIEEIVEKVIHGGKIHSGSGFEFDAQTSH